MHQFVAIAPDAQKDISVSSDYVGPDDTCILPVNSVG